MGKHGSKAKGGWRTVKRRRSVSAAPVGRPMVQRAERTTNFYNDHDLAMALWSHDYDQHMLSSLDACPALKAALTEFVDTNQSRHQREVKDRDQREEECNAFFSTVMSLCTKFVNQKSKQFIIAARSISALRQRMRGRQWRADAKLDKSLYSKPTTKKLLQTMADCDPGPSFTRSKQMSKTCYDQCHIWDSTKTTATRKRGNERANLIPNADGEIRKQVTQITVINHINFAIDASKYWLTEWECEQIDLHGPYKHPYETILPHHIYRKVQADLKTLWREHRVIVETKHGFDGVILLVNRPAHKQEASYMSFHGGCIPKCDTKTPAELVRILKVMEEWEPDANLYINVSDGQSAINETSVRRKFPQRYRKHLTTSAILHVWGHDIGGKNFLYWPAIAERCTGHLEKRHVGEHFKNFNEDRWDHLKNFTAEMECALQLFFDTYFMPSSMESWDIMYEKYKHNATLVVMMQYSKEVGAPHLGWMRGNRSNRCELHDVCFGWKLHTSRAAHQTGSVKICLIRQAARHCSCDGARHFFEHEASINMNGEDGGGTNEDRAVEWLNNQCKDYSNDQSGFGDIMGHGPLLKPLLHVDKSCSKETGTKVDLPVRASKSSMTMF